VVIDDVLPDLEAAATGKVVVAWSAGSWMLTEHRECTFERGSITRLPFLAAYITQYSSDPATLLR
jgi:hypothetical protein